MLLFLLDINKKGTSFANPKLYTTNFSLTVE